MIVRKGSGNTHDFAVKLVFFDHDGVDAFRVLEREKTESTGPSSGTVSHHGAFYDLSKLRKVVPQ